MDHNDDCIAKTSLMMYYWHFCPGNTQWLSNWIQDLLNRRGLMPGVYKTRQLLMAGEDMDGRKTPITATFLN